MTEWPDQRSLEAELERMMGRVREHVEQHTLVGRAEEELLKRYPLSKAQVSEFLEAKAREARRDVSDVAAEILGAQDPPGRPAPENEP